MLISKRVKPTAHQQICCICHKNLEKGKDIISFYMGMYADHAHPNCLLTKAKELADAPTDKNIDKTFEEIVSLINNIKK